MGGKVSVVIPTFNGKELLEKNLQSVVSASENPNNRITEIIVVDDGSTDDTQAYLKRNFPQVRLIKHKKNRRFPASINTGVRMSKNNYIVLLNNDVSVTDSFLEKPLEDLEDKQIFAVSFHEKGYGGSKGKFVDGFIVHEGQKETSRATNSFWASGGSCVMKKKIFSLLGGMDEELYSPFYWEDIDLSYRCLKRGYKILWEPDSLITHIHESTNKKISKKYRSRIQERNQLLFIWKNLTSGSYFRRHIVGLFKRIVKNPGYTLILFMALGKVRVVLKKRKREIRESKISDEAIFSSFS